MADAGCTTATASELIVPPKPMAFAVPPLIPAKADPPLRPKVSEFGLVSVVEVVPLVTVSVGIVFFWRAKLPLVTCKKPPTDRLTVPEISVSGCVSVSDLVSLGPVATDNPPPVNCEKSTYVPSLASVFTLRLSELAVNVTGKPLGTTRLVLEMLADSDTQSRVSVASAGSINASASELTSRLTRSPAACRS